MNQPRHYSPQPWIHEANCQDAPRGLIVFRAQAIPQLYPHARPHTCVDRPTIAHNRECVAEPWSESDHTPHPYVESTIRPTDAARRLCEVCRGTHGPIASLLPAVGNGGA